LNVWLDELGEILRMLLSLPGQSSRVLGKMESGNLVVQVPQVTQQVSSLGTAVNRLTGGVIFTGLLLGGVLLYITGNENAGQALIAFSLFTLVWTLFFVK